MENNNFEKLDKEKSFTIYSKISGSESAKMNAIFLFIVGIGAWIFVPVIFWMNGSYDTEFTKYFIISLFILSGFVLEIYAIYNFRLHRQYKATILPIFKNGLLTEGYVLKVECKKFSGVFSRRGYKYKIFYAYTDDYGTEHKDEVYFSNNKEKTYEENQKLTVAFYNNQSILIEYFDLE